MKQMNYIKGILVAILLLCSTSSWAYSFSAKNNDGVTIYYSFISTTNLTCEVTYKDTNYNSYSGSVVIPDMVYEYAYTVISINTNAFKDCPRLTSVTIPKNVKSVWGFTFEGCTGLTKLEVAEGNKYYCAVDGVLYSKDMTTLVRFPPASPLLPSFDIPDGVTSIGSYAFEDCSSLTKVTIPNSVTSISSNAFRGCSSLTKVTIPNSVTSISSNAFRGCSSLTSITIPESVTSIGSDAFYNCAGLTKFEVAEGNEYYCAVDGVLYSKDMTTLVRFPPASPLLPSFDIPDGVTSIGSYAFEDCINLTEVTIPNSVTEIGDRAFQGCTGLKELTIEDSEETLTITTNSSYTPFTNCPIETLYLGRNVSYSYSYSPFRGNAKLTSLTIGNSVTEVGDGAFYGCTGLTSVNIPESMREIGSLAFAYCTGLTSVNIPESMREIGSYAFAYCTGLTGELTIPKSVTFIGGGAFGYCTGLTDVNFNAIACTLESGGEPFKGCTNISTFNFGNSVTIIPARLCYDLEKVTEVTIPNSVTEIGGSAFESCTNLTEVNFNATACTSAGYSYSPVFYGCTNPFTVNIGEEVTILPTYLFSDCTGLTTVNFNAIACASAGSSESYRAFYGCTNISTLNFGDNVTIIPDYLFYGCSNLTGTLIIPNSVTSIGAYAFYDCSGLTQAIIGNSVTEICDYAFYDCSGFTELTLSNSVTSIGYMAFYGCAGLTEVTIPNSVTKIGRSTFEKCTGLTQVSIGERVETIGNFAFEYCTCLTEVTIPANVTLISGCAFYGCTALTTLNIEDGEKTLAMERVFSYDDIFYKCPIETMYLGRNVSYTTSNSPFRNNANLTSLTIGNSVTSIGDYAFYQCTGLAELTLSNSVTEIGDYAFGGCSGLTGTLTIPNSMTMIGEGIFSNCWRLTELTIPNSVTEIGNQAFWSCAGLTSVTIPNSVTEIGNQAFFWCLELTDLTIGESVTSIGNEAFGYCSVLENVRSLNPIPPTCGEQVYYNVPISTCVLHVPEGAKGDYASADTWEDFYNIVEIGAATIVLTYEATNITDNSATLNGTVTAGEEKILEQGFEYWADGGNVMAVKDSGEEISVVITGLTRNTTYTYRAYATTASGTTYGDEVTFTTLEQIPPTVLTYEATDITGNSATLKGAIRVGDEEILEHGFEYWTGDGDVQTITSAKDYMSETITGLELSTTYTYRAYATTESGTTYGKELSFTTLDYVDEVSDVNAELDVEARYTTDGKKVSQPQRGINIIRYSDGTVKKVLVK